MDLTSSSIKRVLLGQPLATAQEHQERLSKKIALPVFSSDAISSTAYATEEILLALVLAGTAATKLALPISIAVAALLFIVAISYRQVVYAYPSGGGSYVVAGENLGEIFGLVAAASLLVDYVMTVAVSVASGVAAITSAFPSTFGVRIFLAVALVVLVAIVNLRGLRESGAIFAVPTYAFVLLCGGLIVVGVFRWVTGTLEAPPKENVDALVPLSAFLVLRAFSGGCSAMTGTEAISNGVPAFKRPESRNAATTLLIMASILAFLFVGITMLVQHLHLLPMEDDTIVSQLGRVVYGNGALYFALQIATMAILVLAANTSFNGFPRLAAILAEHGYLPRQLMNRGDRLVFSNGIIGLALAAVVVILVFRASVHRMIPLYAVGVFVGFTLSQTGMVRHWWKLKEEDPRWWARGALNGFGAFLTGVVVIVVVSTKFVHGAYLVVIAIPLIMTVFYAIHRHYDRVARFLEPQAAPDMARLSSIATTPPCTTVVLLVSQVNEITARSLSLAKSLSPTDVHALTIKGDDKRLERLEESWAELGTDVRLEVVESPYRELVGPVADYVKSLNPGPDHMVAVVIPEFVVEHWWEAALHNQNALRLKAALLGVPWVVVLSVPLHLGAESLTAALAAKAAPEAQPETS